MVAARYRLDRLVAIVDHNRLQQYGWQGAAPEDRLPPQAPGELAAKWAAFGWRVIEVDGHDMTALVAALEDAVGQPDGRPVALIAATIKGRGLSFAEGRYLWHVKIPTDEEYALALAELGEPLGADDGGHAMSLPMGRRDARGLRRDGDGAGRRRPADRRCSTATSAPPPGPRSSSAAIRSASSRWGSPSRTCWGSPRVLRACGLIPFVSTFVAFAVMRPLDQIRVLIAQPALDVKIVGGYAGLFVGAAGKTHQVVDDIVDHAGDAGDDHDLPRRRRRDRPGHPLGGGLRRPRLHPAGPGRHPAPVRRRLTPSRLGRAVVVREGADVTLVSTGAADAAGRRRGRAPGRPRASTPTCSTSRPSSPSTWRRSSRPRSGPTWS